MFGQQPGEEFYRLRAQQSRKSLVPDAILLREAADGRHSPRTCLTQHGPRPERR